MRLLSTNISSPLGCTTEENYSAALKGMTAIVPYPTGTRNIPFDFCAGMFFEKPDFVDLCVHSAKEALSSADIDKKSTVFILSTTKGNMGEHIGETAKKTATRLGIENEPIVVCNACVSGVAAQILASRLLKSGMYEYAVVTGCDIINRFIISGFYSLKALSPEPCRPFDIERIGLNLGEAAATMVFSKNDQKDAWHLAEGAICNDAYHVSSPHPKGDGAYRVLRQVTDGIGKTELACIGVHGTATMYNDQMEAMAIDRANMADIPISAMKGYYGHTLGAAGLVETIMTLRTLDDGIILPSKGFEELGVSKKISISPNKMTTTKRSFVKMLSGFGGVNAAVRYDKRQ